MKKNKFDTACEQILEEGMFSAVGSVLANKAKQAVGNVASGAAEKIAGAGQAVGQKIAGAGQAVAGAAKGAVEAGKSAVANVKAEALKKLILDKPKASKFTMYAVDTTEKKLEQQLKATKAANVNKPTTKSSEKPEYLVQWLQLQNPKVKVTSAVQPDGSTLVTAGKVTYKILPSNKV